jgi:hypothetical protein
VTGQEVEVKRLSIRGLLPDTDYYMTYDGSTTMPACHETVTWVILNKPIYITKQQVGHVSVISMQQFTGTEPLGLSLMSHASTLDLTRTDQLDDIILCNQNQSKKSNARIIRKMVQKDFYKYSLFENDNSRRWIFCR